MPAYCRPTAYSAFTRELPLVETSTPCLFRAACAIARHEHPHLSADEAWQAVRALAATVKSRVRSPSPQAMLAHLHDVLFDVVGFRGNVEDYYNPRNSYVPEVIRTRCGLPITLALVYKAVAEEIGLTVRGINAPGHFLVAVRSEEPGQLPDRHARWAYVDPFYGGSLLAEDEVYRRIAAATGRDEVPQPEWLTPATHRQWLSRMLTNLQAIFAQTGRERDVYAMQELKELL